MKALSLSLLFMLLFCQTKSQDSVIGEYSSPERSTLNSLRHGAYALDLTLQLQENGEYVYSTCAQIAKGTWTIRNNELILKCREKRMAIDSLNYVEKYAKGKICAEDEVFEIKDKKLYQEEMLKNKKFKIILFKE
ncbi:hypothetical protein [Chryseobacterium lacus]|uniref:hypothetical protein n=1 Tax=Chryseobacterium lacus TaxID=2058346 RepID=UPI000F862B09|nr:hypothetical protein [Chryseobacterium lacus]RST29119.1 hypothetical protein EIZ46_00145 [Chryseobacterium lacus]